MLVGIVESVFVDMVIVVLLFLVVTYVRESAFRFW